ncbi:unnamed protein product [Sphagnum balticum]
MRTRSSPQRDEVLNVLSGSSQRSFWKLPEFSIEVSNVLSPRSASLFVRVAVTLPVRSLTVPSQRSFSKFPAFLQDIPTSALHCGTIAKVLSGRSPSFSVRVDLNFAVTFPLRSPEFPSSGS